MAPTLFERRDASSYVPTELAHGPWAKGFLHGGPVCGLAAYAAEALRPSDEFIAARLAVDLHRPVPMAPLEVVATEQAASRRLRLVSVAIRAEGREVTRASALFTRRSEAPVRAPRRRRATALAGPDGLETTTLIPPGQFDFPPGFHREVELRWLPSDPPSPRVAWLRMPMGLVDGERPSPFVHAATLCDLGNAIATVAMLDAGAPPASYINPDATLYLEREPRGDWIALELDTVSETDGVGLANVVLHDGAGPFGRTISLRLFNPVRR
jgi:hypothetical protein